MTEQVITIFLQHIWIIFDGLNSQVMWKKIINKIFFFQLIKTTGDMFRLIPFSVFIIVPFMEFLLPIAIKIFPGLLPSTFQTTSEKEDKLKQALKVFLIFITDITSVFVNLNIEIDI